MASPDPRGDDPIRQRLTALRNGLLQLHKTLLDSEHSTYENAHLISGGIDDLSDRNYSSYVGKLRGGYEITPVLWQLLGRPDRGPHQSESCPSVLSGRLWGRHYPVPHSRSARDF